MAVGVAVGSVVGAVVGVAAALEQAAATTAATARSPSPLKGKRVIRASQSRHRGPGLDLNMQIV
jgi:hypothetical protein